MLKNTPLKGFVYVSLGINLVVAILILVLQSFLPPVVPLFYGLPSGQNQLAGRLMLFIIPAIGVVVTLINVFISTLLKDDFYKKILIVVSPVISFLGVITVLKIVFLVGFF